MRNRRLKAIISFLLLFTMLSGFVINGTAEEGFAWADDAITSLKTAGILNEGFTPGSGSIPVQKVVDLLVDKFSFTQDTAKNIFIETNMVASLTRKEVCLALAAIGGFPPGNQSFSDCSGLDNRYKTAIGALAERNIIKGYGDNTFKPDNTVNNAELAVLLYRTLNKMGGTKSSLDNLKPGAYGYDEVMYLSTRRAIHESVQASDVLIPKTKISIAPVYTANDFQNTNIERAGPQAIWEAWCARLGSLPPDSNRESVAWSVYSAVYNDLGENPTVINFAIKVVAEDRAAINNPDKSGIFSDVAPSNWFYDGVMYLFNNDIVMGYGTGEFKPYDGVSKGSLAELIVNRIKKEVIARGIGTFWSELVLARAISAGYFLADTPITEATQNTPVTREVMAYAAAKLYPDYQNGVNVNADGILEGYTGVPENTEYKKAMAFLLSIDALRGDVNKNLNATGLLNRAEMGVFFARVLIGLDTSKMNDYSNTINAVKGAE